jgi:hypothetical protein
MNVDTAKLRKLHAKSTQGEWLTSMTQPLNIFRLTRNQAVVLNGTHAIYQFCTTTIAAFRMPTGRLREYDLTEKGDVKDWCGHVFQGANGSYGTHGQRPGGYRHQRPVPTLTTDENSFYVGHA